MSTQWYWMELVSCGKLENVGWKVECVRLFEANNGKKRTKVDKK